MCRPDCYQPADSLQDNGPSWEPEAAGTRADWRGGWDPGVFIESSERCHLSQAIGRFCSVLVDQRGLVACSMLVQVDGPTREPVHGRTRLHIGTCSKELVWFYKNFKKDFGVIIRITRS